MFATLRKRSPRQTARLIIGPAGLVCLLAQSSFGQIGPTPLPVQGYEVENVFPHDQRAFTQGFLFEDGFLYESTGLRGRSTVRRVDLKSGKIQASTSLIPQLYGEGLTAYGDELFLLTWKAKTGFIFDKQTLKIISVFDYPGEGWGLTSGPDQIYMSDGTSYIRMLDPVTLREMRRVQVTANGKAIDKLNELEWVKGEIFANVWKSDRIAKIDPKTGQVTGWIDLSGLRADFDTELVPEDAFLKGDDVLNGIAYDAKTDRLFVTGKFWKNVYEISLKP